LTHGAGSLEGKLQVECLERLPAGDEDGELPGGQERQHDRSRDETCARDPRRCERGRTRAGVRQDHQEQQCGESREA
jgi:hypothetical protein